MENNDVMIEGRMGGKVKLYKAGVQLRAETVIHVDNSVTGNDHAIKVRATGMQGVTFFLSHLPGREVQVHGHLKAGNKGRMVVIVDDLGLTKDLPMTALLDNVTEKMDELKDILTAGNDDDDVTDDLVDTVMTGGDSPEDVLTPAEQAEFGKGLYAVDGAGRVKGTLEQTEDNPRALVDVVEEYGNDENHQQADEGLGTF